MKKILIITALAALASVSQGKVLINWSGAAGFYFGATDPGVGILGDATGNSTFAQLIYSVDEIVDNVNLDGSSVGDDVVWATTTITEDTIANDATEFDSYGWFTLLTEDRPFVAGFVYARIFQDDALSFGDAFKYSDMEAVANVTGATPPQMLRINKNPLGDSINTGPNVGSVVPEPATALLLAIGGGLAYLGRYARKYTAR